MSNSWPPIMHIKSKDLKRCLGDIEMDNRTAIRRLSELGFSSDVKYIETAELIEKVKDSTQRNRLSHVKYVPKSTFAKKL